MASAPLALWLAGWRVEHVRTESMRPRVPAGSLVLVEPVVASAIQSGDVIAFRDPLDTTRRILHRVTAVEDRADAPAFRTKGDANPADDPAPVLPGFIEGRMRVAVPNGGRVLAALSETRLRVAVIALAVVWLAVPARRPRVALTV